MGDTEEEAKSWVILEGRCKRGWNHSPCVTLPRRMHVMVKS